MLACDSYFPKIQHLSRENTIRIQQKFNPKILRTKRECCRKGETDDENKGRNGKVKRKMMREREIRMWELTGDGRGNRL